MNNPLTKKLLPILILSILVFLCDGDNKTTIFHENEDNLIPNEILTYIDNTVVFRLVKKLSDSPCYDSRLMFRILYPNGTSNLITIQNHGIPPDNFCTYVGGIINDDVISFLKTVPNYILVIYKTFKDVFGMMIEWNGNIKSNTLLGSIRMFDYIYDDITNEYNDDENQYEYLFFEDLLDNRMMVKKFIAIPGQGELVKIQEDIIQIPVNYGSLRIFRTINSGFLFIFNYNSTNDIAQNTLSLEPEWRIYGSILQKDTNQLSDLFLIYQTAISPIKLGIMNCFQFYDGNGFYCIMLFTANSIDFTSIRITFLSNGRIAETKKETDFDTDNINGIKLLGLESGGYIIATIKSDITGCSIIGYFLGPDNKWIDSDSNPRAYLDHPCRAVTTINNTALIVPEKKEKYWTLVSISIPYLMNDKGYDNPIIDWSVPAINETIALGTTQIQIIYKIPIQCSSQNISVYQKFDDMKDILRETYSGQSNNCQVLSDNTTLSLTLLPSTFNQPNSVYYVKIDADFVRRNKTLEPLRGISKNKWIFTTKSHQYMVDDRSTSGFLRLTNQGTLYFENLSSREKSTFIQNLTNQLAGIIPVQSYRIKSDNRYQVDTKAPLRQILINIRVLESNNISELDISAVINSLDILVRNKGITPISANNLTSILDNMYGFQKYSSFRDIITIPVIVIAIILFILIICYIIARRRYKKGENETIIITAFVLYDFVLDLLFVVDLKNKNLLILFWLNLTCTILPILLNLFVAVYIISQEYSKNPKFRDYFVDNMTIVSICSVLAGADIKVLQILSSKIAGLSMLSATFSEDAQNYIFWCALIGFLIEDIPQFGIQVAYNVLRVEYTIIPALTLISSIIMLLINIMGRLYNVIIKCKKRRNSPSFEDDTNSQVQQITDQEIIINDDKDDEGDKGDKDNKAADN